MKNLFVFTVIILLFFAACKTSQDATKTQPILTQSPTRQNQPQNEDEKQKLMQMEYKPEVKQLSSKELLDLESLAMDKANLNCKKQILTNGSEPANPDDLVYIDEQLIMIEKYLKKMAPDSVRMSYFEKKFTEFLQNCM